MAVQCVARHPRECIDRRGNDDEGWSIGVRIERPGAVGWHAFDQCARGAVRQGLRDERVTIVLLALECHEQRPGRDRP